jgi:hypothetical protein
MICQMKTTPAARVLAARGIPKLPIVRARRAVQVHASANREQQVRGGGIGGRWMMDEMQFFLQRPTARARRASCHDRRFFTLRMQAAAVATNCEGMAHSL